MADLPRLNSVIRALEAGQHTLTCFAPAEISSAVGMATSKFDGCVFEMEHQPWDGRLLRDCLQYMLNRAQIAKAASVAPGVTPMVRIPVNGVEMAQWQAKQALDMGLLWRRLPAYFDGRGSCQRGGRLPLSAAQDRRALRACWHPRRRPYNGRALLGTEPAGLLSEGDVWPLNPQGEIFCILQIEDTRGVDNLDDILKNVPGIGCILIGEGDLSQELGYPRQYEHKVVLEWMKRVVDTCKKHNVVVGHPHVEAHNVERVVAEGYRFLMCAPVQSYGHFEAARKATKRA